MTLELTFFDIFRSQVITLEENVNILVLNKIQSEKKFYAFNVVFRGDVKLFHKIIGRLPADHFHDPQSLPRIKKQTKKTVVNSNFAFFDNVSSLLRGLG